MPNPDIVRSLFNADCTLIMERHGSVSWCDEAATELFGIEKGSSPGWDFPRECGLFFPDSATPLRFEDFPIGRIFTGEPMEDLEVCVRGARTGGVDVWLSVTAEPVFSPKLDEVEAAIIYCHDITDRKKALQGLEDAHAALQALVHASPLPILAMETDGRINFWNRAAERVFGWTESEVLGKQLPYIPEERREESREMRERDLAGEVVLNHEIRRHRKDGSMIDLMVSAAPIRDRKGALKGTICVYVDVTERKQLEERLRQAAKLESLGMLAGGVAHDFNNLLTSILGHTSLALEDTPPGSEPAKALHIVMTAVERAVALTSQMLAYAGQGKFCTERLDLSALIEDLLPLIRSSLFDENRRGSIALELDLARGLPPVEADRGQMRQVIVNLVLNAREAIAGTGTVCLRTGESHLEEFGSCCFIEVRDGGCGMDRATKDRMFDPFFSTKFTGRGLGLAAVMGIVRGHKGSIRVITAPNEGSRVLVYLPVAAASGASVAGGA